MSATRDTSQKIGFVYSNLYSIYKKGVAAAKAAPDVKPVDPAITSLKDNLKALNDLHGRLKVMLIELEDLVKKD